MKNRLISSILTLILVAMASSLTGYAQGTSKSEDGGGGGPVLNTGTDACLISGNPRITNLQDFPFTINFQGTSQSGTCPNQTSAWSVIGSELTLTTGSSATDASISVANPAANGSKIRLTYCCSSNDCETCEETIVVDPPAMSTIIGAEGVNCNSTMQYTPLFFGDNEFTAVSWTTTSTNVTLTPAQNNNITVSFGPGNYNVQLCATACYGSNCEPTPLCKTIRVGRSPITWVSFDENLCIGQAGTYTVNGGVGSYVWRFNGQVIPQQSGSSLTFTPTVDGTLSATGTNSCGFTSTITDDIDIVMDPPLAPGFILNQLTNESPNPGPLVNLHTCSNSTLVLKLAGFDPNVDQAVWSYQNVTGLPAQPAVFNSSGLGNMTLEFKYSNFVVPNLTGTCRLEAAVTNGCITSNGITYRTIDISPNGTDGVGGCGGGFKRSPGSEDEELPFTDFQISPNPASTFVNVYYNLYEETSLSMSLVDALGKEVIEVFKDLKHSATQYHIGIDTYQLPVGLYFCVLRDTDGRVRKVKRLMLQR